MKKNITVLLFVLPIMLTVMLHAGAGTDSDHENVLPALFGEEAADLVPIGCVLMQLASEQSVTVPEADRAASEIAAMSSSTGKKRLRSLPNAKVLCSVCGKGFTKKGNLNMHIVSVHKKIIYPCDRCDKDFTQKGNLKKHRANVHERIKSECPICNKKFEPTYLNTHIDNVHKRIKKHQCPYCKQVSVEKSNLTKHIARMHSDVIIDVS